MLKIHRIRKAKTLYNPGVEHILLEFETNRWLEIETLEGITKVGIDAYLSTEQQTGIRAVGFTEQSFQNGVIKDWDHSGWIK